MSVLRALVMLGVAGACTGGEPQGSAADSAPERARAVAPAAATREAYLISSTGIGAVRLAMTLDEARRAIPSATFARTSDGDGAALVEVTLTSDTALIVFAGEDDASAPIDWTKRISMIETFSPAFATAEGVRPGALVRDVESVFGRTREIVKSEIESREYIAFENQPTYLTLRLDYTGVFQGAARATKEYQPDARILSIAVSPD